jgi:hemerythrin superfamily protein
MADTATDVMDVLKSQHKQIERLLGLIAAKKGAALEDNFCELRRLIAVHETAEEEVIYPILRSTGDAGGQIADARTTEEAEGTKVLAQLEDLERGSAAFKRLFKDFRTAVLHHAQAEEAEVIPLIRATQTPDVRQRMAEAFRVAEQAAPTHPHPHVGTSATAKVVTGPALTIIDRVRDALQKSR